MLTLRFAKPAIKALLKMPTGIAKRMRVELDAVAANPAAYRGDWKPLQGSDFWRLRVGDWRAICEIRDGELVLLVVKIAPRGDANK
jgi:mRNA interferase RelE/StbE